ncbi:MAG: glycosyltransferase family 1 protein [Nitrospirota bacterium]
MIYTYDIFSSQTYGGISRYFIELIKGVRSLEKEVAVFAGLYINEYISSLSNKWGIRVPNLKHTGSLRMKVNALLQECILSRVSGSHTVVHQTYYYPLNLRRNTKYVVTVYDMIHELYPQYLLDEDISARKKECCERADKIIAISNSTKDDLVKLFKIKPEKISVIHLANSLALDATPSDGLKPPYPGPYLLYVGQRSGYKNYDGLLQAYAQSKKLIENYHVICFGGGAFNDDEIEKFKKLRVSGRMHHVGGDDTCLAHYYKHASAFIYPSLYEGFGIPLLEAMGQSCPVICSNTGSIPEVVGDAGAYFDPTDIPSIQQALEVTLFDETTLARLKEKGAKRKAMFSWDTCARETLSLYYSLIG